MKTLSQFEQAAKVKYNDLLIRVSAPILPAHLIVVHSEEESLLELFQMPGYYVALAFSTLMAWSVIEFVFRVTSWLDKKYLWIMNTKQRVWRQLLLGIVGAILICIAEATVYFACYRLHIVNETDYFPRYIFIICLLVVILNAYYVIRYFIKVLRGFYRLKREDAEVRKKELAESRHILSNQRTIHLSPLDMVLFYCHNKNYFAISSEGEELIWIRTIEETLKLLPKEDYCQVNRTYIVKRSNIEKVCQASSSRKDLKLKLPVGKSIVTSQLKTPEFILWWAGKIDNDFNESSEFD